LRREQARGRGVRSRVRAHDGTPDALASLLQRLRSTAGPSISVRRRDPALHDRASRRQASGRVRRRPPVPGLHVYRQCGRGESPGVHGSGWFGRRDERRLRGSLHTSRSPRRSWEAPRRHAQSRVPAGPSRRREALASLDRARTEAHRIPARNRVRGRTHAHRRVLPRSGLMSRGTAAAPTVTTAASILEAPLDGRGWDAYAAAHPSATLFHQPAWLGIVQETFGYRSISLLARRGDRTVGFLPLFLVPTLPLGRAAISTPFGVYGGAIADDLATEQALLARGTEIATERGARYLELRHERAVEGLP